jgi:hypothetical protein
MTNKVVFSDRLREMLSDPEAAKQFQSWMASGKPELITIRRNGDEITVRPEYVKQYM